MYQDQAGAPKADLLYAEAGHAFAPAIARIARAFEADRERARELEQDIHLALWRSFNHFEGRCGLGTWVYRIAHNVAASHVARTAPRERFAPLDEAGEIPAPGDPEDAIGQAQVVERLHRLIRTLRPADRQLILLYLDGLDAASISEVTGLAPGHVSVKVHRTKTLLARHFEKGKQR